VTIDIHPNGDLAVTEQNVYAEFGSPEQLQIQAPLFEQKAKRLAKVLDVADDLGVWGEWLRQEAVSNTIEV
jgi:hypothetical protein